MKGEYNLNYAQDLIDEIDNEEHFAEHLVQEIQNEREL